MIQGAIAGAVGTMALDVTSYADMALRARSSSTLPAEVVKRMSARVGIPIENDNRASALGALSGYTVGVGIGVLYGALRALLPRAPLTVSAIALGAAAMIASDVPATQSGATNPRKWGFTGWVSDLIPHAAYGFVTAAVFDAINGTPAAIAEIDTVNTTVVEIEDLSD